MTTYRERVRPLLNSADAKRVTIKLLEHLHEVATKTSAVRGAVVKGGKPNQYPLRRFGICYQLVHALLNAICF